MFSLLWSLIVAAFWVVVAGFFLCLAISGIAHIVRSYVDAAKWLWRKAHVRF